jgi:glycosyltransferase involved in cell wall biosynthesis
MIEVVSRSTFSRALSQRKWPSVLPAAVLCSSILVTVCFWIVLPEGYRLNEQSDYYNFYEPVARNIVAGRGFIHPDGSPATEYTPGYPLMVAGVFKLSGWLGVSEGFALSVAAAVGMGLTAVFVFLLARDVFGAVPGLIASVIWMTYPFALWLTKQPNSEIPFMVVFYGGLYLFWRALRTRRWPPFFACGLLFGAAMLIRPIAIAIGFVLALITWLVKRELASRKRLLLITALLLGNFVAVLPWEAWVHAHTGRVVLLCDNGVKSIRDGLTFGVISKGYRERSSVPSDVASVMNDLDASKEGITSLGDVLSLTSREFRAHPVALGKLLLLKAGRSWYGTDTGRSEYPILLIQFLYLALILWAARRIWRRGGLDRQFLIGVCLVVVYFWGMTFLVLSILRYMVPVTGLLFILVGGAFLAAGREHPWGYSVAERDENRKRRWLILTQYYPPEIGAPQIRLRSLARELGRNDIHVEVLTAMPNYPEGKVFPGYSGKLALREEIDGVSVRRSWVYAGTGKSARIRLANYLSFTFTALLAALSGPRPDVLFVESQPLSLGIVAIAMKWLRGVPYVYNVPDLQIDVAQQMGFMSNRALLGIAKRLEDFFLRQSWKISTVTHRFIEHFEDRGLPRGQISFLPNGADSDFLKPREPCDALLSKWGLHGKKVFLYVGTHAYYHRLDVLIEAATLLRDHSDIAFLMVGSGPERARLEQMAAERKLPNVVFGQSPYEEMDRLYSIAFASVATLRNMKVAEGMRLSKIFPALSCGVPVIYAGFGEAAELLEDSGCGVVIPPEMPDLLAEAILKLCSDPGARDEMGRAGRKLVESEYGWSVIVGRWLDEIGIAIKADLVCEPA